MSVPETPAAGDAQGLYLDLLKRALVNTLYHDVAAEHELEGPDGEAARRQCAAKGLRVVRGGPFDPESHGVGRAWPWPASAHTMVGLSRLDNVQRCVVAALDDGVPGDFIETGVWRGGVAILMRAVLKVRGVVDRTVWAADSFEGLPPPNADRYPHDAGDVHHTYSALAVSLEQVQDHFARYGLLDDQVRFLKGWFKDTLPAAPPGPLAVARLDGDMYESTMDALVHLYPRLSVGGFLIVDDYGCLPQCKQAVEDYRADHGIDEPIHAVDWTGVWWRKAFQA